MSVPSLIHKFHDIGFEDEEVFEILTKIISVHDFKENNLYNIQIYNDKIVLDNCQYLVQKKPVYPDNGEVFEGTGSVQPIKHEIVLKEIAQNQIDQKEIKGDDRSD